MNAAELTLEISGRWQLLCARVDQWGDDVQEDHAGARHLAGQEVVRRRIEKLQEQHCDLEREWCVGMYRVRELLFEIIEVDLPTTELKAPITSLLDTLDRAAGRLLKNRSIMADLSALNEIAVPNPVGMSEGNAAAAIRGMRELAQCVFGPHNPTEVNQKLEAILFPAWTGAKPPGN